MLITNNIQSVPTTLKPPNKYHCRKGASNNYTMLPSACKESNQDDKKVAHLVHRKCAAAQYAIRTAVYTRLYYSPGEVAFRRNMLQPFASQIIWDILINQRQDIINQANMGENMIRQTFEYKVSTSH